MRRMSLLLMLLIPILLSFVVGCSGQMSQEAARDQIEQEEQEMLEEGYDEEADDADDELFNQHLWQIELPQKVGRMVVGLERTQ